MPSEETDGSSSSSRLDRIERLLAGFPAARIEMRKDLAALEVSLAAMQKALRKLLKTNGLTTFFEVTKS